MQSLGAALGEGVACIPVLKANAYGLGAVPVARALCSTGLVHTLAVAQVSEGVALRQAGITQPDIFVLGGVPQHLFALAVQYDIQLTLFHPHTAVVLSEEAARQGKGAVGVHLKIETGLHRAGAKPGAELQALAQSVLDCKNLQIKSVFTHFADGERADSPLAKQQYALYRQALAQLRAMGIDPPLRHVCNSGGSEWYTDAHENAVRLGRRLYMDNPLHPLAPGTPGAIQEVCSWRSWVTNLRTVMPGETIGYDAAWTATRPSQIATVCVGYCDGLYMPLTKAGAPVLVGSQRGRLIGTCMDQCFVDVTDIPCAVGDEVTFFGTSKSGAVLSAQEVATLVGEEGVLLTSLLTPRVARVYVGEGAMGDK
jgi:alanine racemase